MTNGSLPRTISQLADGAGVLTDWIDAWNDPQKVNQDDLLGVLSALIGRDLDSERAVDDAISEIAASRDVIEPVLVAWDGALARLDVDVRVVDATIVLEDGSEIPATIDNGSVSLSTVLPTGYHDLILNGGDLTSHVFSAPTKAFPAPRGVSGLISPTYSMRGSSRDAGVGAIAQLRQFADICSDVGIDVVGTLPLLAAFPDEPSPYAPASRRAWNELFVDFDSMPGWEHDNPIRQSDVQWVDYAAAGHEIRSSLATYTADVSQLPRLRASVGAFLDREPEMRRYAEFRATADVEGRNWRAWPESVSAPSDRLAYHETVQWLMNRQMTELGRTLSDRGQYLYLDLPIGCHPDGFDIWDTPELFAAASLGAPPDTLFVGGQDWGLPATIPRLARREGHLDFRKAIRHQLSAAGLLRIDHVMGIHRTWWVPHGAAATQGAYVRQPTDELFAIICIESVRARVGVVGENLGTVPPEIRTGLDDHELLGMAMANEGAAEPRATDLVALSSHDTPAFAAWWVGSDIDDLLDLGVFDEERAHAEREGRTSTVDQLRTRFGTDGAVATRAALMEWMAATDAAVALFNLDDLLMEERRQNVPGTHWERPNWRLRHRSTLDELQANGDIMSELSRLVAIREGATRT